MKTLCVSIYPSLHQSLSLALFFFLSFSSLLSLCHFDETTHSLLHPLSLCLSLSLTLLVRCQPICVWADRQTSGCTDSAAGQHSVGPEGGTGWPLPSAIWAGASAGPGEEQHPEDPATERSRGERENQRVGRIPKEGQGARERREEGIK